MRLRLNYDSAVKARERMIKRMYHLKEPIDFTDEENEDGAPYGNDNAAGPHQRSGLSNKDKRKYARRLTGKTTGDGITIKSVSNHAFDRCGGRNLSVGRVEKALKEGKISQGNTKNTRCYDYDGCRIVVDIRNGKIVTTMWRHEKEKK